MAKLCGNTLFARALYAEGADAIFQPAGPPMFDVMWFSSCFPQEA